MRLTAGVALVLLHFVPFRTPQKQKEPHSSNIWFLLMGGESEIRTHGTLPHTRFPSVRLKPLGHLSIYFNCLISQAAGNIFTYNPFTNLNISTCESIPHVSNYH